MRTMNKFKKEYLVKHYTKNGESAQDIADKVGCSKSIIYKYLRHFGIKIEPRGRAYMKGCHESRRKRRGI